MKAVFFDRDGIILKMVYNLEHGIIETPKNLSRIEFVFGIADLLKHTTALGYKNIIISNQSDLALKKISRENFDLIKTKMTQELAKQGAVIDAQYYCFHHPFGTVKEYTKVCDCRKPKAGLLLQAARENNIDLSQSWMIGDGVNDVIAGHKAGCKTILAANVYESEYLRVLEEKLKGVKPDYLIKNLSEAIKIISQ